MKAKLVNLFSVVAIVSFLGGCGQPDQTNLTTANKTSGSAKFATAAIMLGSGKIVSLNCVKLAAQNNTNPSSCAAIEKTASSSERAIASGANDERGCYQANGWFDYYGSASRTNYVYYYQPTSYNNFCSQVVGVNNNNCNRWLGWNGSYIASVDDTSNLRAYSGNGSNSYSNWFSSLGNGGGWFYR